MLVMASFWFFVTLFLPAAQQATMAARTAPVVIATNADVRALAAPTVTLTYNHPRTQPTSYVLLVREDGTGHFHSEPLKTPPPDVPGPLPSALDTDISISQQLRDRLFEVARGRKVKSGNCDDGGPKIAFQGTKRLIYEGAGVRHECEFNWSRDKQIQALADQLQAVAQTLEAGRRLEVEYLHDRLGLDAEIEALTRMVAEGQAAEIGNIAPQLRTLANDPAIMDRVRRRAQALLEPSK